MTSSVPALVVALRGLLRSYQHILGWFEKAIGTVNVGGTYLYKPQCARMNFGERKIVTGMNIRMK